MKHELEKKKFSRTRIITAITRHQRYYSYSQIESYGLLTLLDTFLHQMFMWEYFVSVAHGDPIGLIC